MSKTQTGRAIRRTGGRRRGGFPWRLFLLSAGLFLLALGSALLLRREPPKVLNVPVPQSLPEWIDSDVIPENPYSRPGTSMDAVNGIVVHYVGNPGTTAAQNRSYFAGLAQSHETSASSHFIIGLEGEVLLCVPIGEVAYCSNDRNGDTLSIEVCHPDDTGAFTPAAYDSLIKLVNWLREFYGLDEDQVIRHYDVSGKVCPRYYVEHPEAWEAFLGDLAAAETASQDTP